MCSFVLLLLLLNLVKSPTELPAMLCDVILLKKLVITNCHQLSSLPKGIGKLVNLEVLRLRYCTDLSELPESIKSLNILKLLDISDCLSIRHLPKEIGELCKLVANPYDTQKNSDKCSRNSFFFNSSSSRLMKVIRLIPNIHVLKQQI